MQYLLVNNMEGAIMKSRLFFLMVSFIFVVCLSNLGYTKAKATISGDKIQLKKIQLNGREDIGFFIDDNFSGYYSKLIQESILDDYLSAIHQKVGDHLISIRESEVKTLKHIDEINDKRDDFALFYVEEEVTFYDLENLEVILNVTVKPYILVHKYRASENVFPSLQVAVNFPNELQKFIYDKTNDNTISKEDEKNLMSSLDEFLEFNKGQIVMEPKIIVIGEIGEEHLRVTMKVPGSQQKVYDYYLDTLDKTLFSTYSRTNDYYGLLTNIKPTLKWTFILKKDRVGEDTKIVTGPLNRETFKAMYANVMQKGKDQEIAATQVPQV